MDLYLYSKYTCKCNYNKFQGAANLLLTIYKYKDYEIITGKRKHFQCHQV